MNLYKLLKYLAFGFGIIGIILTVMIMSDNLNALDYILYLTYLILFIIIALVLIYVVKGLFAGNIKKTLLSLGLFFGILVISYFLSSGTDLDLTPFNEKGLDITESISKNVGAGLYAFYFLMIGAIVAMLVASTKKIFNK